MFVFNEKSVDRSLTPVDGGIFYTYMWGMGVSLRDTALYSERRNYMSLKKLGAKYIPPFGLKINNFFH